MEDHERDMMEQGRGLGCARGIVNAVIVVGIFWAIVAAVSYGIDYYA